jgi:hypothetical protein
VSEYEQGLDAIRSREELDFAHGDPRMAGSKHPDAWPDPAPVDEEEEQHSGDH